MATDPLAIETAARKAADDALDTRLKAVEAKVGIAPPVVEPPITQPPVVTQPPATTGVYGPGVAGDSRANLQVGYGNRARLDYRFRSIGGQATTLRVQQRGGPVYSGGNGGTIKATIQADNGGLPSGTPLAAVQWNPGNPAGGGWEVWTQYTFPAPPMLAAGAVYHLVFENIATDPVANYISLNMLFTFGGTTSPRHAAYPDDFATLYATTSGWKLQANNLPIFDLAYASGQHDGQGYIGTMWDRHGVINGTANMVREKFTVSGGNRTVSRAHVRLKRISGTGNLVIRLETGTGSVVAQATVPATQVAIGTRPDGSASSLAGDTWVNVAFPAPIVLTNGQAYALRLSTDAATTYTAVPIQKGTSKGLRSRVFADGDGQRTTDGGANWANIYAYDSADLQMYLDG